MHGDAQALTIIVEIASEGRILANMLCQLWPQADTPRIRPGQNGKSWCAYSCRRYRVVPLVLKAPANARVIKKNGGGDCDTCVAATLRGSVDWRLRDMGIRNGAPRWLKLLCTYDGFVRVTCAGIRE